MKSLKINNSNSILNARICRRSQENIIFLWDLKNIPVEDRDQVKILNDGKALKIRIANSLEELTNEKMQIPDNTAVCLVNHEENNLNSDEEYVFVVKIREIEQEIRVLPYGVLPEVEKDEKERHIQLMAWDQKRNRWRKVCGVETSEGFALLVKNIK